MDIHDGLIAVRDELYGQAAPHGRYPIPVIPAGFPYDTQDIRDYSYYGIIRVNLTDSNYGADEYKNEIDIDSSTQFGQSGVNPMVTYFMDPSHGMFLYEWDFLYDGLTFDVDGTGWPCPYIDFTDPVLPGKRIVGMRITTNSVPPQQYVYEIPVYAKGQEYLQTFTGHGNTNLTTNIGQGHAVFATEDKFYVAYTSKESGVRNVYMSAVDRYSTGTVNTAQVTFEGIEDCFNPAFTVVEDGDVDRIYLLFKMTDGGSDSDLYSTYNTDGLDGFIVANIKQVETNNFYYPYHPSIIFVNNTLYAYYRNSNISTFRSLIRRAKSTDLGNTWTGHENIDDNSDYQSNPSIGYMEWGDYIYCVWEDDRNAADYGLDLYIEMFKESYSSAFNLTQSRENTDEIDPSVAVFDETLAVAYVELDGNYSTIWLKTMRGGSRPGTENYIQSFVAPLSCSSPSVAMCANNQFTVAFSQYNTNTTELKSHVRQYYESEPYGHMQYQEIENETVGNVPVGGASTYPGVACRRVADGYAIEHYVARKSYTSGYQVDGGTYYGLIDVICYITHGDKNDPY
ncbi:MAG: sialidase family protein [bacterium]